METTVNNGYNRGNAVLAQYRLTAPPSFRLNTLERCFMKRVFLAVLIAAAAVILVQAGEN